MKKSFTLIEILVVVTIIGLLTTTASVSYTAFLKQSRDAKRKADIEQLRAALEMYRSNNNEYPLINVTQLLAPVVYIHSIPTDPMNPTYTYYYSGSESDYTLGAYLESTSSCPSVITCTGANCNYCVGPYGKK